MYLHAIYVKFIYIHLYVVFFYIKSSFVCIIRIYLFIYVYMYTQLNLFILLIVKDCYNYNKEFGCLED